MKVMKSRETKVIELVGLPGCGKTTSLESIISQLDSHNIMAMNLNKCFRTNINFALTSIVSSVINRREIESEKKSLERLLQKNKGSSI